MNNETRLLWKIQILPEWGICFYPEKVWNLLFLWNNTLYHRPYKESHITFHNTWRVHVWKNNVIFDYWFYDTQKKANIKNKTRDSISNHKPQLLFKIKISEFELLDKYDKKICNGDIHLELTTSYPKLLFRCWVFSWKDIVNAMKSWYDPYWVTKIWIYTNTYMMWLWEFEDASGVKDWTKIIFLVLSEFEESETSIQFQNYSYILSVSPYSSCWSIPY